MAQPSSLVSSRGGDVHVSAELRDLFFSFSNWIFKMYNSDHTQINFPADQEDCTFIHLFIYFTIEISRYLPKSSRELCGAQEKAAVV